MPKGRRYQKKKGGMRKRGYGPRRRGLRRMTKAIHYFKEMTRMPNINIPAGALTSGVLSFSLSDLVNQAQFKGLFDLYKLTGVKVKFLYRSNSSDTLGALNNGFPTLYTALNRDPKVPAPTSVSDILNDDTCKIHRCDGLVGKGGIYIKSPKPDMTADVVNPEGVFIGTALQQWQLGTRTSQQVWLTTGGNGQIPDQSTVKHYGLRYYIDNTQSTSDQILEVYTTLYFQMKEQD